MSYGDGSDPKLPDQYGPPGPHYYKNKAAAARAEARIEASRKHAVRKYEAKKKAMGAAYARKFNRSAK